MSRPSFETPAILITDDDRAWRETLEGVFAPRGYRTLLASDGGEALEIVEREEVHVLLADLHMPRIDGLELVERLVVRRRDLPAVLMTADRSEEVRSEARARGFESVLTKPVSFGRLTQVIGRIMRSRYDWPPSRQ